MIRSIDGATPAARESLALLSDRIFAGLSGDGGAAPREQRSRAATAIDDVLARPALERRRATASAVPIPQEGSDGLLRRDTVRMLGVIERVVAGVVESTVAGGAGGGDVDAELQALARGVVSKVVDE